MSSEQAVWGEHKVASDRHLGGLVFKGPVMLECDESHGQVKSKVTLFPKLV